MFHFIKTNSKTVHDFRYALCFKSLPSKILHVYNFAYSKQQPGQSSAKSLCKRIIYSNHVSSL